MRPVCGRRDRTMPGGRCRPSPGTKLRRLWSLRWTRPARSDWSPCPGGFVGTLLDGAGAVGAARFQIVVLIGLLCVESSPPSRWPGSSAHRPCCPSSPLTRPDEPRGAADAVVAVPVTVRRASRTRIAASPRGLGGAGRSRRRGAVPPGRRRRRPSTLLDRLSMFHQAGHARGVVLGSQLPSAEGFALNPGRPTRSGLTVRRFRPSHPRRPQTSQVPFSRQVSKRGRSAVERTAGG